MTFVRPAVRRVGPFVICAILFGVCMGTARAPPSITPMISYRVTGAPNYSNPGGEGFWTSIPWTIVPLVASVSPGGGHTPEVETKSAHDGYNLYVLFRWNDSVGPSYASNTELYQAPNGTLVPLTPAATATVTQLYYNSTYYYQDRIAMLWFIANNSQRAPAPVMQLGTDGAITNGAADIWHWQSNPTDNDPLDAGFPGGYTDPSGKPIYPADNLSYAEDDYTNMTGFWITPGSFGAGSPNLDPYADPYLIHVGNVFDNVAKQWTVEMVRTLTTTSDASRYQVQLSQGMNYYVAFAVWNGRLGESSEFKSVSQWYNLTVSGSSTPTPAVPAGGVSPALAGVVAVGALIVGVAVGWVLRWRRDEGQA